LQKALKNKYVELTNETYYYSNKLTISESNTKIIGNGGELFFLHPSDTAIVTTYNNNNTYPVSCIIENIAIRANKYGFSCGLSYSSIENLSILITDDGVALIMKGDPLGTGSYYNRFTNTFLQGIVAKKQRGIIFVSDQTTPTRSPNANTFTGGRMGQFDCAITVDGGGNSFNMGTFEQNDTIVHFNSITNGALCVENAVNASYVELAGVEAVFGLGASECLFSSHYETGVVTRYVDNSTDKTSTYTSFGPSYTPSRGKTFYQVNPTDKINIKGPYPGITLSDPIGDKLTLTNETQFSSGNSALTLYTDNNGYILKTGHTSTTLKGSKLSIADGALNFYTGTTTPTFTAQNGDIFFRTGLGNEKMYTYVSGSWKLSISNAPNYSQAIINSNIIAATAAQTAFTFAVSGVDATTVNTSRIKLFRNGIRQQNFGSPADFTFGTITATTIALTLNVLNPANLNDTFYIEIL
jgi:hypothetical protein